MKPYLAKVNEFSELATPKVGMLVLTTDLTCEHDFFYFKKKSALKFDLYAHRIKFQNPITHQNLEAIKNDLTEIADEILPGETLDMIVFNCTAASAILGEETIRQKLQSKAKHVLNTAASAAVCMQRAKAIDLLCPYPKAITMELAKYYQTCGLNIVSLHYMDIKNDMDIARIGLDEIKRIAVNSVTRQSDTLFISCTAMRVAEFIPELERVTGKKVFSSNQATFKRIEYMIESSC